MVSMVTLVESLIFLAWYGYTKNHRMYFKKFTVCYTRFGTWYNLVPNSLLVVSPKNKVSILAHPAGLPKY